MAVDDLELLEQLLTKHNQVLVQKWLGAHQYPYQVRLGSGNRLGRGETLLKAFKDALEEGDRNRPKYNENFL